MAIFSDNDENQNSSDQKLNQKEENLKSNEIAFDKSFENNIRPQTLADYIGQCALKNTLKISIEASKKRQNDTPHHALLT